MVYHSDSNGKVDSMYGVYDNAAGAENRGRFLIDPNGVVQGLEVLTPQSVEISVKP